MEHARIYHLYRDGRHYDQLFGQAEQDLPFWIVQAERYGGPILELACGTGRICIPLAKQGFEVAGMDHSAAMLNEARAKASAAGVSVEWIQSDMRDFDLGRGFSLILLPANALCHLLNLESFEGCMSAVQRHLQPDGRFIVDVFVPRMELLLDKPGERFPFAEYDDPDGRGKIVVTESYVYEPDSQIKKVTTFHSIPGEAVEMAGRLDMRMYFPQELDALLKYNGFEIVERFGNYDETPFDSSAEKQLIVCRVKRSNPAK